MAWRGALRATNDFDFLFLSSYAVCSVQAICLLSIAARYRPQALALTTVLARCVTRSYLECGYWPHGAVMQISFSILNTIVQSQEFLQIYFFDPFHSASGHEAFEKYIL